ncbi:hypothetical protein ACFL1M_04660, partial [Patescibacteria group bacterium]
SFDEKFLELVGEVNYTLCVVVIDKKQHFKTYTESAIHPYHYCLTTLLERYTSFLSENNAIGDVMAESRGGKEDRTLKDVYSSFYLKGTAFRSPQFVQNHLTSKKLKTRNKIHAVAGLEMADLLSLPTKLDVLHSYGALSNLSDNFTKKIIGKVQSKYRRKPGSTRIKGYGKKLIF